MNSESAIPYLLTEFPGFDATWQAHVRFWNGEPAGLCNDMGAFAEYTSEVINSGGTDELRRIFATIERFMTDGDEEVRTAVATCVLETLLNYHSAGRLDASKFTSLLAPHSRAYCKAWDSFTGIQTPGVWDEAVPK